MKLKYVQSYRSHGKVFFYVRRKGARIRLPGDPMIPENAGAYLAALAQVASHESGDDARRPKPRKDALHLYVLQAEDGPIKVGRSSDPQQRLADIQCASARRIKLVKVFEWMGDQERSVHAQLASYRLQGEWFSGTPECLAAIRAVLGPMRFDLAPGKHARKAEQAAAASRRVFQDG